MMTHQRMGGKSGRLFGGFGSFTAPRRQSVSMMTGGFALLSHKRSDNPFLPFLFRIHVLAPQIVKFCFKDEI